MVKKTIFTLMLLAVIGYVSAQSLQFEWNGHVYSDGETIECTNDEFSYGEYIQHMQLRNLTSGDLNIIVEKDVVSNPENMMNWFCWGVCVGPDVIVSPNPVTLPANSVTADEALSFHALFEENVFGKVEVKYYAYDERHPEERITIDVVFHKSGVGVGDHSHLMTMSSAYPNPASSLVHFDYSFDGNLSAVVYNLLGQEVMRQTLNANAGQMTLSVAELQDGIYFCTMMVDGRAYTTKKFVVKK